jgi:hypothetical protein
VRAALGASQGVPRNPLTSYGLRRGLRRQAIVGGCEAGCGASRPSRPELDCGQTHRTSKACRDGPVLVLAPSSCAMSPKITRTQDDPQTKPEPHVSPPASPRDRPGSRSQVPGKHTFRLTSYESAALRARRGTPAAATWLGWLDGSTSCTLLSKEKPISVGPSRTGGTLVQVPMCRIACGLDVGWKWWGRLCRAATGRNRRT